MNALARIRRSRASLSATSRKQTSSSKPSWASPAESVGHYFTKIGRENCWEALGPARAVFEELKPAIKQYLDDCSEPLPSWVIWSIYMVGNTPDTARPVIIFCCEEEAHRKQIRNTIRESGILNDHPAIALKHLPRAPDFNQLVQLASNMESGEETRTDIDLPAIFSTASRIAPGARILVRNKNSSSTVRKATIGGCVKVGSKHYCMTASHAFSDDPPQPSLSLDEDEGLYFSDSDLDDVETPSRRTFSIRSNSTTSSGFSASSGSTNTLDIKDSVLARARLRAAEATEPTGEDNVDGYANSNSIGNVKLCSASGPQPELDYALIELSATALTACDCSQANSPGAIDISSGQAALPGPENRRIITVTASGGRTGGQLSGTSAFLRLPNARKYQEVYSVTLDKPVINGDCGSWVFDANSGALYGHIVAGSPSSAIAYIVPMPQILNDIEQRLGQKAYVCTDPMRTPSFAALEAVSTESEDTSSFYSPALDEHSASQNEAIPDYVESSEARTSLHSPLPLSGSSKYTEAIVPRTLAKDMTERFRQVLSTRRMKVLRERRARDHEWNLQPGWQPPPEYKPLQNIPIDLAKPGTGISLKFRSILFQLSNNPLKWENPGLLDEALQVIPLDEIYRAAEEAQQILGASAGNTKEQKKPEWGYQDCVIHALLRWFKRKFFTWVDNPVCSKCRSPTTAAGPIRTTPDEYARSAYTTELYRCSNAMCGHNERFARYTDAFVLLKERRGRAWEWANCFGMLCRAIGSRVRWVWNAEDHVWIEVYSDHLQRWVHVDPCEEAWDNPRLYTEGWGKKLSYCLAFSLDGAVDVTRRYVRTSKYANERSRCSEAELSHIMREIRQVRLEKLGTDGREGLEAEFVAEQEELNYYVIRAIARETCNLRVEQTPDGLRFVGVGGRRKASDGEPIDVSAPSYVR